MSILILEIYFSVFLFPLTSHYSPCHLITIKYNRQGIFNTFEKIVVSFCVL